MSFASLRHHMTASALQLGTIAATGAFLTYVLGQIVTLKTVANLRLGSGAGGGELAQLVWILVVSLLVCTISNITSMLLSVTKRFREIGTMKCLGAFDGSILALFLTEAVILGGAGALAGAAFGGLFSLTVALTKFGTAILTGAFLAGIGGAMVLTFFVVMFLSFVGAAYPAWKASRMLPIEAMRNV